MRFIVKHFATLVLSVVSVTSNAVEYYVSPTGNDDVNDGRSTTKPFLTIQHAADLTNPGDVVNVMNGTYRSTDNFANFVEITRAGKPSAWITYRAYPGHKPKLETKGWHAMVVKGAAYIVIDGFEMQGGAASLTLAYARSQQANLDNPLTVGNCVGIVKSDSAPTTYAHHVIVRNNRIHHCSGGGIYTYNADYVTLEDNVIYDSAFWSPYANSGISLYQNRDFDLASGYHNIVRRNRVYGNRNYIPFFFSSSDPTKRVITDGNGIIVDDSRNTQNGSTFGPSKGRIRIENNIIYGNGARGIHIFSSDHVDIVNNTAYKNSQSAVTPEGEFTAFVASDVKFVNNIAYSLTGRPTIQTGDATQITIDYNVFFNGATLAPLGSNNIVGQNPLFVNESTRDFHLLTGSPAIDTGTSTLAAKDDFDKRVRPQGASYDRGAFEVATNSSNEIILDNLAVSQRDATRSFTGAWCTSIAANKYGSTSLYSCGAGADTYRWTPNLRTAGKYQVYVWWASNPNRSTRVPISVVSSTGSVNKIVDQKTAGGSWVLHDIYSFTAGTTGYVEVSDVNGQAGADAVKFVPVP
jgi:parallel beta-helix repeat protein